MPDDEDAAVAAHTARSANLTLYQLYGDVEHLRVHDSRRLNGESRGERPPGAVVGRLLWIIGRPELLVEQSVSRARIGLVHAHDVAARRELLDLGLRCASRWRRGVLPGPGSRTIGTRDRNAHRKWRGRARNFDVLFLENPQQLGLRAGPWIRGAEHVSGRPFGAGLQHRALALLVEVLEEETPIRGEVVERDEEPGLLVIVVVAERPHDAWQRGILPVPRPLRIVRSQRPLERLGGAAIAERLLHAADAVVHRRQEHEITGRPGVEVAVREDAPHAESPHLLDLVADHQPA